MIPGITPIRTHSGTRENDRRGYPFVLTDTKVKQAKAAERQYKLYDEKGLYLIVTPSGSKWWRFKYRYNGKEKTLSLGVYDDTSLKKARQKRKAARELLADGIDPSVRRRAEKESRGSNTFEAVAREWLEAQKTRLAEGTRKVALRRLETWVFPHIGSQPISKIEPPEILRLLRKIESTGKHETAHRIRERVGQVFRYAISTGRADRDPTADLRGALSPVPTKNRAAITDPKKVGELLRAIDGYSGQPSTCAALKLLPLVFLRPGELRLATWPEIDLKNAIWRIPGERMKMGKEHLVPLSKQAVSVLKELKPITERRQYVFESLRPGRPLSENTINAALRTLGYSGDEMTSHGFRAMASTLLHERGWPPEVIELQLAHAQRSQVAAAYNRSARLKERKRMMQKWADYLDRLRAGK